MMYATELETCAEKLKFYDVNQHGWDRMAIATEGRSPAPLPVGAGPTFVTSGHFHFAVLNCGISSDVTLKSRSFAHA